MILHPNVKINLGLNVLRRREDCFHDIETVFLPYSGFSDTLDVEASDRPEIVVDGPCYTGWNPREDLCFKAWQMLAQERGIPAVRIHLTKTSPVGAGLGGGSSDAAFCLRALDRLFSLGLDERALLAYASRLGSDCSFFVLNRPCFAQGRGELLSPSPVSLEDYEIKVEIPSGEAVSTREAYGGIIPRDRWTCPGVSLRDALARPVEEWKEVLCNDFEKTVFPLHPGIARLKQELYDRGAVYAAMSGSGSAVFGLFRK